jgi:L-rhamnose mutarotase
MIFLLAGCGAPQKAPQRYAMVIGLKAEKIARYEELHADPWEGVLRRITACNIRNYSIYKTEIDQGKFYLFGYFEYVGDDFEADMDRMAGDAETQRWWKETDPCQLKIATAGEEDWWVTMDEVFHHD